MNLVLFGFTLLSVIFAGALYSYSGTDVADGGQFLLDILRSLPSGIPFAVSMLAILLAHEFSSIRLRPERRNHVWSSYFVMDRMPTAQRAGLPPAAPEARRGAPVPRPSVENQWTGQTDIKPGPDETGRSKEPRLRG